MTGSGQRGRGTEMQRLSMRGSGSGSSSAIIQAAAAQ